MRADASILVLSCSWPPYRDMGRIWWPAFRKFWPDCRYPVSWIECGDSVEPWYSAVRSALCSVSDAKPALVWVDDFILTAPVDGAEVARCVAEMRELQAVYYRLQPVPEAKQPFPSNPRAGPLAWDEPYVHSLHLSFWSVEHLDDLMKNETPATPWDFELAPCSRGPLHVSVTRDNRPISHVEACKKGELTEDGKRLLAEAARG